MKKTPSLLIKNVLLLLLYCSLPGTFSNREVNDLQQTTSRQNQGTLYTPHTTSSVDSDLRRNSALKSTQQQRWNSDSPRNNSLKEESTSRNKPEQLDEEEDVEKFGSRTQINTQEETSTQKNRSTTQLKRKNEEAKEEEDAGVLGQTTTVHMPTYFSYGTTRRANSRDRVNANRNSNGRTNDENEENDGKNSTSSVDRRINNNHHVNDEKHSTSFVNARRNINHEVENDQNYGRKNSRIVTNGRSNNRDNKYDIEASTSIVNSGGNEDSTRFTDRRNKYYGENGGEYGNTGTPTITSNQPTMTSSSDFFKLTSPKQSTFGRRVNSTEENDNYPTKYTTRLPSNDGVPTSQTSIKYMTSSDVNPRGSRILTGRRKVNAEESTTAEGNSDKYLERIQQQLQASTFSPFPTTSYHDADKNLEYKKKAIKKETEGDTIVVGGGKVVGEKQQHVKESGKIKETETQKNTEIWDDKYKNLKESKDTAKMKEPLINMTQKPIGILDERYSTIIDTLSKGSGNLPQNIIIESQKNVTINNEPGTNLLETENVGSKEANEKRETKGKDDDEAKNGGDVIPVIIKNSVVGEGVSDLLNKTSNFRYPGEVKSNNESLFPSTLRTNVGDPQESSESNLGSQQDKKTQQYLDKNVEIVEKITQSKIDPVSTGKQVEVEKDDQEFKKKIYNLKKPLLPSSSGKVDDGFEVMLPPSGGKLDDGFEVMLKNGSTSADDNGDVTYLSSAIPSLELNKTTAGTVEGIRSGLIGEKNGSRWNKEDETKTEEEEKGTKMNELQKTRISSSTSRITSSFSSSSNGNKLESMLQQEYTTFSSNNLENNIITTSSPMFHGFTSTTPRLNHYISMRTTTTVQSQPATSAGENLIKQISSFNPRKRPAVTFYQSPSPESSTEKWLENHSERGEMESSSESHSNERASHFEPGHRSSSTRPSTIRKIVPWSTRLQKTTLMPETTTMDHSDEITTPFTPRNKMSSIALPDWSDSSTTSRTIPEGPTTDKVPYTIPTATFVTSVTPSSSTWTTLGYSSRASSRFVDGTSSVSSTNLPGRSESRPVDEASSESSTDSPGKATSRFIDDKGSSLSTLPPGRFAELTKLAVDASAYPGRTTTRYLDETTTVPTSSSQSLSITTAESLTSVVDLVDSAKENTIRSEPSANTSGEWGTTRETNSSSYPEDSTSPNYLSSKPTQTWETTLQSEVSSSDHQRNNKTTVESSLEPSSSPLDDLVKKFDDMFDSTTWSTYDDGNSTEDLQFGDGGGNNGRWKSTTTGKDLGSTGRETTVFGIGESEGSRVDGAMTTASPAITSKLPGNLTSTSGLNKTTTSMPHSTSNSRQNTTSNSISKEISTSGPYNYNQNSTLIMGTNLTSTTRAPETEDFFETDEEEMHTTTMFSSEGGEFEHGNDEEDDRTINNAQTTVKPNKDNRIIQNGSREEALTTERDNFIMKISTTESPLWTHSWTTDSEGEITSTVASKADDTTTITTTPSPVPVETAKPTPVHRPIRPVTIQPDLATTNPQYMGLSLLIKGSTLQEICNAQQSLKRAIIFLFRNTTGRVLYEDQIVFPNLTPDECNSARSLKTAGLHNVDMVLYDEDGNFDDELNSEFRMLWENNGLRTNIAIHDVYLILRPSEDVQTSGMTIAVIVIACIGLTCLLLFFVLMMVLRKRQKKFNYGQRCTPVSLDDYSLDNISVYNSMRRKNARRASKRSYGNPAFDDPSAPSHQMSFAALAHFSGQRTAMDDEFSEIPMVSAKMDELPPGAETRNRYANVIPLPETRVQLSVRDGDDPVTGYINANYVKGPKGAAKFYIACQAPMQSTVNDFWKMIWEQQSKLILMLTDLHENGVEKCFDYLPPSEVLDCHRLFGDYQVTLKKREVREKYVISHLQLKNLDSNLWREVTHLWYTSWPHQGTPSEGASIIAYLIEARSLMRNSIGPHIVHCSPGVGRTGTVLAIDLCIREFETSRMVDVPRTVYGLRRNRAGCVQTKDQYAFIYMVLNVYGTKLTGGTLDSM